jgi:hypothetical protein
MRGDKIKLKKRTSSLSRSRCTAKCARKPVSAVRDAVGLVDDDDEAAIICTLFRRGRLLSLTLKRLLSVYKLQSTQNMIEQVFKQN